MSFNFRDYPSTSFYDGDLGYLVKAYKKLVKDYDTIKNDYDDIIHRYEQIQKDIETFPAEMQRLYNDALDKFQTSFDEFSASVSSKLSKFEDEMRDFEIAITENQLDFEAETTRKIDALDEHYSSQLSSMREEISTFEYRMQLAWTDYRDSVNRIIDDMQRDITVRINASQNYVKLYADGKIMESEKRLMSVIDQWSKDFPPVLNPITGETEPLDDVLRQIWETHVCGIKVEQLVDSHIKVEDLVAKRLKVIDIVTKGYALLYWRKPWKMYSPFTGQYVNITDVVYQLAALHKTAATVGQIHDYKIPVENVVDSKSTVYDIVWKGGVIFAKLAQNL